MQVAAPLKDTNGVTRGALALIINPDAEFTRILSVARSGETGETFAFDPEGVMISKSRFEEQLKVLGLVEGRPGASSALTLHLTDPGGDLTRGFKPGNTNAVEAIDRDGSARHQRRHRGRDRAVPRLSRRARHRGVDVVAALWFRRGHQD